MNLDYLVSDEQASFEKEHWWIKSRFQLIDRAIQRLANVSALTLLEIGCGTGVNMDYLETHYNDRVERLIGVDPGARPVQLGKRTILREAPSGESYDLILAMDVLEHVTDPIEFLKSLRAQLKPQGVLLITVPAFQWLWSAYDEVAHHRTRYRRSQLLLELAAAKFKTDECFYLFALVFPAFVLQRLRLKLFPSRDAHLFKSVHPWINRWLYKLTAWEMKTWMNYNRGFGSSVVALAHGD